MAISQVSASLSFSIRDVCSIASPKNHAFAAPLSASSFSPIRSTFASGSGSPLLISRTSHQMKASSKTRMVSIRSESSQGGSGLDVWLGRFAMTGFAVALTVEVVTGKGILENFGLITPLPTVALGVTALVGVLTAIFIFQSASKN